MAAKPRDRDRASALSFLNKNMPSAMVAPGEPPERIEGISSGCLAVDMAIGNGGFPRGKLSEVFGPESCLDGESRLNYVIVAPDGRRQNSKGGALQHLYDRFHRLNEVTYRRGHYARSVDATFTAPCMNEDGRIFSNQILDVVNTGQNPCLEVVTRSGERIVGTENHRVYTGAGYARFGDLAVGDTVYLHDLGFAVPDTVVRISSQGRRCTYDLKMASPFNNYVADRFVVHNSGKTTLCLAACARAQAAGLYPVYIDIERGLDPMFADKIGFRWNDPDLGLYIKPDTFEQVLTIIETMSVSGEADIIVVDSVPAMVPEATMDPKKSISEIGLQPGTVGRLFSVTLPRMTKIIERTRTAVVFTNQLRANIEMDPYKARFAPREKTAGGYALKYFASLRVEMRQIKKNARVVERPSLTKPGDVDVIPVASKHAALAFKNKVSMPYRSTEFYIRYDKDHDRWGIDDLQTVIDMAIIAKVIDTKGGGHFVYNGAKEQAKVQGEDTLYDWFAARPESVAELMATVMTAV